ncbi:hypothetical protein [Leptospira kmetyi]|uniref:hypothetical protein n=1 Tax=Leptospira kmetyi TaxID=408139 RepID=UPI0002896DB8|nr:hypothetical protein [Leptospira kmetyi]EQA55676.1 hypothetical protein LEP1GSC052_0326 [Leptospira kmetyi serovar Malaysia str. Bejo-Iso9]
MKETFLDIPIKRYVAYVIIVLVVQTLIAFLVSHEVTRNVLLVITGGLFSLIGGFVGHFLVRFKVYLDLLHLARKMKGMLGFLPDIEQTDSLYSFWARLLGKSSDKPKAYASMVKVADYVRSHFFADNPAAFEAFFRDEISTLSEEDKVTIGTFLVSEDPEGKWRRKYDRTSVYSEIAERAESNAKLVQDLREFIKAEEVSLRFANIFRSREFDLNTPYLILGKFANIQAIGSILTEWVTANPFIPIRASGYANFPEAIKGGNVLIYLFIPPKFYRSAEQLFKAIAAEYSKRHGDIEQVFLVIASVFYDSSYIHIGTQIKYTNSLVKGLRQFLFFKTGNRRFSTGVDIGKELLNSTDQITFQRIIQRLPLRYYVKGLALISIEMRALDSASANIYSRFSSIYEFFALPESEAFQVLKSSMDMRSLRYTQQHYSILNTSKKKYKTNKESIIDARLLAIYQSMKNGHIRFQRLINGN